jgi:hypothetical protein
MIKMEDEIWECKDGRRIAVADMAETHVRNTLRMILRARREKKLQIALALLSETLSLTNEDDKKWGSS